MPKTNKRKITIREIADRLGLSISTVSRALHDRPDINLETRRNVLALATELHYIGAASIPGVSSQRKHSIGVIIPGFVIPFYASALSGIQNSAGNSGYNVIICQSEESYDTELENLRVLKESNVDGLIVSVSRETRDFEHFRQIIKDGIPVVFFNRVPENINAPGVLVDDFDGAYKATMHLIEQGCKRIAHIAGPQNIALSRERLRGYQEALRDGGLTVDNRLIINGDFTFENGMECAEKLHNSRVNPDGLFAICDAQAFGALVRLKELKYRIPEDIAIIGFTDEPSTLISSPTLSSVAQPCFEIGKAALDLLLHEMILGKTNHIPEIRILKTELKIRESSLKAKQNLKSETLKFESGKRG